MIPLIQPKNIAKKQKGATLITALSFLVLMTLVSVSATKISILDVLVSGNDQQQMVLAQNTENCLTRLTRIQQLSRTFTADGFQGNVPGRMNDQFLFPDQFIPECITQNVTTAEIITDVLPENYPCERQGRAMSMGPGALPCDLFDFQVQSTRNTSGTRELRRRGAGKMIPDSGSDASLL